MQYPPEVSSYITQWTRVYARLHPFYDLHAMILRKIGPIKSLGLKSRDRIRGQKERFLWQEICLRSADAGVMRGDQSLLGESARARMSTTHGKRSTKATKSVTLSSNIRKRKEEKERNAYYLLLPHCV